MCDRKVIPGLACSDDFRTNHLVVFYQEMISGKFRCWFLSGETTQFGYLRGVFTTFDRLSFDWNRQSKI